MQAIQNPILRGFNPDPSIIRVGEDYYIATSTFEWFPGIQIHHSTDLVHWNVVTHPLNRVSQLDMKGVPDSCGVWAPCLSYKNGTFYLVYSNVKSFHGLWKDTPNYVVTTNDLLGDWSEPVYLGSAGFDGSMFHDEGGKSWFLAMLTDHTDHSNFFGGIVMQEFDESEAKLVGEQFYLTKGTELGCTEGPHLYKKDGYYYLLLAEGGTEYEHAITIMRSKEITGPYELHPSNPILTSWNNPKLELQKSGHGCFVEAQNGDWYVVFLVGRPLTERGRCTLGRETAIEEIIWKEGWPYLKHGGNEPRISIPALDFKPTSVKEFPKRVQFSTEKLDVNFQSLRIPIEESWCSLKEREGFLRLRGRESLSSTHEQSLVARRVQAFHVEASTKLEFTPENFHQMAGLVFYYNTGNFYYLNVSTPKLGNGKQISIISSDVFRMKKHNKIIDVSDQKSIVLRGEMNMDSLQFSFSTDEGNTFQNIGEILDASILSDDYVCQSKEAYEPAFTGTFVGIACQDLAHQKAEAFFEWFQYQEL